MDTTGAAPRDLVAAILFAVGMSLDWAFAKPVRKVYYNLTITGLSVFIGAVELLGCSARTAASGGGCPSDTSASSSRNGTLGRPTRPMASRLG
jgi:hypothetical protein